MEQLTKNLGASLLLVSTLATLSACGGGGSSGNATDPGPTAATQTSSIGQITAFGSVVVNGVRYNTDNAQFTTMETGQASQTVSSSMPTWKGPLVPSTGPTMRSPCLARR